jgi:hypothetical protein
MSESAHGHGCAAIGVARSAETFGIRLFDVAFVASCAAAAALTPGSTVSSLVDLTVSGTATLLALDGASYAYLERFPRRRRVAHRAQGEKLASSARTAAASRPC